MPSYRARLAKLIGRFNRKFVMATFYPISYQRFITSEIAPRLIRPGALCECRPVSGCGVPAAWAVPTEASDGRAILYLHGGGYAIGSLSSHRSLVEQIAVAAGCPALMIDYRLAPESRFPAAVEDAIAAYEWLLSQGVEAQNIIIAGDSAGGGLSVAAMLSLRDSGRPLPAAAVLLSPWVDIELSGGSVKGKAAEDPMLEAKGLSKWGRLYAGDSDPRDPLMSPIHARLDGLPPMMIQVGSCEILLDDSRRLALRAAEAGVTVELDIWDGMFHVWQAFSPFVPESKAAIQKIGAFCRDAFAGCVS